MVNGWKIWKFCELDSFENSQSKLKNTQATKIKLLADVLDCCSL